MRTFFGGLATLGVGVILTGLQMALPEADIPRVGSGLIVLGAVVVGVSIGPWLFAVVRGQNTKHPWSRRQEQPKRDTRLRAALMYAATGRWGIDLLEDGADHLGAVGSALSDFQQHAVDGRLQAWGKPDSSGPYVAIPAEYWTNHRVDFLELFKDEPSTSSYYLRDLAPRYHDIMVSRAEVQSAWPKARPWSPTARFRRRIASR